MLYAYASGNDILCIDFYEKCSRGSVVEYRRLVFFNNMFEKTAVKSKNPIIKLYYYKGLKREKQKFFLMHFTVAFAVEIIYTCTKTKVM